MPKKSFLPNSGHKVVNTLIILLIAVIVAEGLFFARALFHNHEDSYTQACRSIKGKDFKGAHRRLKEAGMEQALSAQDKLKLEAIRSELQASAADRSRLIPLLQMIQERLTYLPPVAIEMVARHLDISPSEAYGVATFYKQFFLKPRGKNIITACCGTVCHVKGSDRVITRLQEELKLKKGEDTTADMQFTLETINCLGVCSVAPVVIINQKVHGQMTPDKMSKKLSEYREKESE